MYRNKNNYKSVVIQNKECLHFKRAFDNDKADYVFNACGFFRNDFAQLQEAENALDMARILSRLKELGQDENNDNKSFEELVGELRSRYCQLPNELDRFETYLIDNAMNTYKLLKLRGEERAKERAEQERLAHEQLVAEAKASLQSETKTE